MFAWSVQNAMTNDVIFMLSEGLDRAWYMSSLTRVFAIRDLRHLESASQRLGNHQDNRSVYCIPPYTPLLYSKNRVHTGIHFFLFLL